MYVEELMAMRRQQVERRREAARESRVAAVMEAQATIEVIDHAIADERDLAGRNDADREVRI